MSALLDWGVRRDYAEVVRNRRDLTFKGAGE